MSLLKCGDAVGIIACSNGLSLESKVYLNNLKKILNGLGLKVVFSEKLFKEKDIFNGTNIEKAQVLMRFFKDKDIKVIFDVSGGDLANGILEYLNFEDIKNNPKPFFGYSDLSVVLNSLYSKSNVCSYLYQIRNLIGNDSENQIKNFKNTFIEKKDNSLLTFNYRWIQGEEMEGIVIGGNIRCFLKLAGTEYIPDFNNKILFLESLSGNVAKMSTYINQYKQIGAFDNIKGIILGNFTEMEDNNYSPNIAELIKGTINNANIPIIKTEEIGHKGNSKCIIIGEKVRFKNKRN